MEKHGTRGAWFLTLILLGSCASSTTVPEAIDQLDADTHQRRLEAIQRLGRSDDPRAGEALVAALDEPGADAAEREETWLEVARALERLAGKGLVGEEALPVLDGLAARQLGVGSQEGGPGGPEPGFPYDLAAADAARIIRQRGARRSAGEEADGSSGETRARFLAELAWIQRVDEDDEAHETALEDLKELGAEGIAPSVQLLGRVRAGSRGDMVAYFLEMHAETGDKRCARALLALARSRHEGAWRPALAALSDMGDARASKELVKLLDADGVPDVPHTHATLSTVGSIGSEKAIPFLVGLFGHGSRDVARSASSALVDIGAPSVPALMQELSNVDRQNRMMAALSLSSLDDSRGREAARRFLGTARSGDDEETMDEIRHNLRY